MGKVFAGFVFVLLDFNLNLGSSVIGIIPDFIGYYLIYTGLSDISFESGFFERAKPVAACMIAYSLLLYIMDFFGFTLGTFGILAGIIAVVLGLYISNLTVLGILDIEASNFVSIGGDALKKAWNISAALMVLANLTIIFPVFSLIFFIGAIAANIYFLVMLNRTKILYYNLPGR